MGLSSETLMLVLAAITGTSGLTGAVAWFATLRPRIEGLERDLARLTAAVEGRVEKANLEHAQQWSAIRRLDRRLAAIEMTLRLIREQQAVPSRVSGDVTPIIMLDSRGAGESHD